MEGSWTWSEADFLTVSGSKRFAREMAAASPSFASDLHLAIDHARRIWLHHVDVHGWLQGFAAHPPIGSLRPVSPWSKEEQSAAMATATDTTFQELEEWNAKYRDKFGFVFLICASGKGTPEILAELKRRYENRPIVELETAAQEELKIIELRLAKLFASKTDAPAESDKSAAPPPPAPVGQATETKGSSCRTRPPITTHVLDVARGSPAAGMEVQLERWKSTSRIPSPTDRDSAEWMKLGSSSTNSDGRSGQLMDLVDDLPPGFYRVSFDTGKYAPHGFFPYVDIVFEIRENQKSEHFHVPLLYSPFSFTTYRGS